MLENIYKKIKFDKSLLVELEHELLRQQAIQLWVYRTDKRHLTLSGNKWYKLKYNLAEAAQYPQPHVVTFGGAYSNHIYATAAAGALLGFQTSAFIRGEAPAVFNPTLRFAQEQGMHLRFVSRTAYRDKTALLDAHADQLGEYYLLPEGGTNALALKGCAELAHEVVEQLGGLWPDHWTLACGTGGTMAGLLTGLQGKGRVHGFSALKGDFMASEIQQLLATNGWPVFQNWEIHGNYHFGGYAKHSEELLQFINDFYQTQDILLDPVYNGKHFYGLFDLIQKGYFPVGSTIVAIHSGGLQGNQGFNERFGQMLIPEESKSA
ncbi:MAG: pyridoxal-phosphate dependent enzyme [Bacteroidota bacterium]